MDKKKVWTVFIVLLLLVTSGCKKIEPQEFYRLSGKVMDWERNGLKDVEIYVTLEKDSSVLKVTTDSDGLWNISVPQTHVRIIALRDQWTFTTIEPIDVFGCNYPNLDIIGTMDEEVNFPDPILEAVIREHIGKFSGQLRVSDVIVIKDLSARDRQIKDLRGLEHCLGLESVSLSNNPITDISPLLRLKMKLKMVFLDGTDVQNLHLFSQTNIQLLSILDSPLTDLSFLNSLTFISCLNLSSNIVTDFSPLSNLSNLGDLRLGSPMLTDVSFLGYMPKLVGLRLDLNQLKDISVLEKLPELTVFTLCSTQVTDINVLLQLKYLRVVRLRDNINLDLTEGSQAWKVIQELLKRGATVSY